MWIFVSPDKFGGGWSFPSPPKIMKLCVCVFLVFSFLFVQVGRLTLRLPVGERLFLFMSPARCMAELSFLHLFFEARSTYFRRFLWDTRPLVASIVVLRSCCCKQMVVWAIGDRHVAITCHGVFSSWIARDGHAPSFMVVQGGAWGIWRLICCKVTPGTLRVLHELFFRRRQPLCRRLGLSFSVLFVYSLCFSCYSLPL